MKKAPKSEDIEKAIFFYDNEIKEHNKDILFSTFLVLKDIIKAEEIFEKE